jgi:hypothetical protein
VTLVANVTTVSGAAASGTITIENGGAPVSGCSNLAVTGSPVACQVAFGAAMPPNLTAVFAPSLGSPFLPSASAPPYGIAVAKDGTSTSLDVSNPVVNVGGSVTYKATVAPNHPGPLQPSGGVGFFDGGTPIESCAHQDLALVNALPTTTCTVHYGGGSVHNVTAQYTGDGNFIGSTSPPVQVTAQALPPEVLGTIRATMQWTFLYTPTYTKVLAMVIDAAPVGATILINCHGRGCPFAKQIMLVKRAQHCNRQCRTRRSRTIYLTSRFRNRRLFVGMRITVEIIQAGWIGKYYNFTMRSARAPRIQIACLAPGGRQPGRGC